MTATINERTLKVGVLTPHAAAAPEIEIPDLSQGRVTVTVARIRSPGIEAETESSSPTTAVALRSLAGPEVLDGQAARFHDGTTDVVVHASTTTGYALGAKAEAALVRRLATQCAVPVVVSAGAAVDALRVCGVHQLILIHPPWFDNEIDRMGISYFRDQGLDVTLLKATGLPRNPAATHTAGIIDWISRHLDEGDEALFIAGTGFRAARAVAELEQRTNRLVLQANQVLLWSLLAATRTPVPIEGGGKLFQTLLMPLQVNLPRATP